jgi:hypothetical protein
LNIPQEISTAIQQSLDNVAQMTLAPRDKSRQFVHHLAAFFERRLGVFECADGHVAWRDRPNLQVGLPDYKSKLFGNKEVLFDIGIYRVMDCSGYTRPSRYISSAFLILESEINRRDASQVLADFSKLLITTADWKVLIAQRRPRGKSLTEVLTDIMLSQDGTNQNLIVSDVPDVRGWSPTNRPAANVWQYRGNTFVPV